MEYRNKEHRMYTFIYLVEVMMIEDPIGLILNTQAYNIMRHDKQKL